VISSGATRGGVRGVTESAFIRDIIAGNLGSKCLGLRLQAAGYG